jgi:hypothetical protein
MRELINFYRWYRLNRYGRKDSLRMAWTVWRM